MARPFARRWRRLVCIALAVLLLGIPTVTSADTTAETGITVTTTDSGTFALSFEDGGAFDFTNADGSSLVGVSAVQGSTARTELVLVWTDTRMDAARSAYTISLRADALTADAVRPDDGEPYMISAESLRVTAVAGDPLGAPMSLDAAATVFRSDESPAAGDGRIAITVELVIPPGTYPARYATTFTVAVDHSAGNL